jgi:hypothetical protein
MKGSIGYIGNNSGTSTTILLSENLQVGVWALWDHVNGKRSTAGNRDDNGSISPTANVHPAEPSLAFTYPVNSAVAADQVNESRYSQYSSTAGDDSTWSYHGYDGDSADSTTNKNPAFINVLKEDDATNMSPSYRTERPSSYHPGIVVAAFADRSVRTLNEDMSKIAFVLICSPNSGKVVDLSKL